MCIRDSTHTHTQAPAHTSILTTQTKNKAYHDLHSLLGIKYRVITALSCQSARQTVLNINHRISHNVPHNNDDYRPLQPVEKGNFPKEINDDYPVFP